MRTLDTLTRSFFERHSPRIRRAALGYIDECNLPVYRVGMSLLLTEYIHENCTLNGDGPTSVYNRPDCGAVNHLVGHLRGYTE